METLSYPGAVRTVELFDVSRFLMRKRRGNCGQEKEAGEEFSGVLSLWIGFDWKGMTEQVKREGPTLLSVVYMPETKMLDGGA